MPCCGHATGSRFLLLRCYERVETTAADARTQPGPPPRGSTGDDVARDPARLRARLGTPGHCVAHPRRGRARGRGAAAAGARRRACTRWTCRRPARSRSGRAGAARSPSSGSPGAVDEAGYLAHNQSQAERGAEPVDHFCRRGWRALRNPSLDFDVWWYWAEYLDPTDESETAINPLVHYLLDGRHRGLLPLPQRAARPTYSDAGAAEAGLPVRDVRPGRAGRRLRRGVRRRAGPARRRVRAGRRVAGARPARPAVRPRPARGCARTAATTSAHGACWPGSWSAGTRSRRTTRSCSRTTRAGCSGRSTRCSREMDARPGDFWGLQLTARRFEPEPSQPQSVPLEEVKRSWLPPTAFRYPELVHVGSYFLALRRPVLDDPGFRRRLDAVRPQRDRANLVQKYETGTTQYLVGQGFDFSTWVPDLRPNHPIYGPGRLRPAGRGVPAVQAPLPGREPLRHPGPGRLEAAHPGRRPRRAGRRVRAQPAPRRRSRRARAVVRDPVVGIVRRRLSRRALGPSASWATSTRRAARAAKECSVRTRSAAARRVASSPKTESGSARVASRARSSGSRRPGPPGRTARSARRIGRR